MAGKEAPGNRVIQSGTVTRFMNHLNKKEKTRSIKNTFYHAPFLFYGRPDKMLLRISAALRVVPL